MASDELNYNYQAPAVSPLVERFDDEGDQAKFVALQEQNVDHADRLSSRMADRGVPESKRPV